ncbi:MAG: tRNA 2-thiouridine(34) synthase MnmA [Patescibacteria group bacterium]
MIPSKTATTKKQRKKIALGMSGGVDSSVCAHLLVEQGYEVTGVYLECWKAPGCRSEEDRKDALEVALALNIPFQVLDFKHAYRDKVVQYFFDEYQAGRTPNPDVLCNKEIKFGLFYDWALREGFDAVATGHYAAITTDAKSNQHQLAIPVDAHKDQTYFLYLLTATQLEHIHFPLGKYTKSQVRAEAKKRDLPVATKKDSVGICFIGDIDVSAFLKDELGENPGEVVDTQGNVIGSHRGLWFYTVGQRHGFSIEKHTVITQKDGSTMLKQNFPPYYVIKKNAEKNQLVVGFGSDTETNEFTITDLHWIQNPPSSQQVFVRIRHTGQLLPAELVITEDCATIRLHTAVKGIAAGQSAVIYNSLNTDQINQTVCLGGGIIT